MSPGMGFDVLYLPPIHPIGRSFRKGRNNSLEADRGRSGQPLGDRRSSGRPQGGRTGSWARWRTSTGSSRPARRHGLEIALDLAYQASPDHPYVKEHPEWFRRRPDGTIKYAENPPKKYQDIYPINFESDDWQALWTRTEKRHRVLDQTRREDFPRRQSAHEAVRLLGVGARRHQARVPGRDLPLRSIHPAEDHALSRQVRLHPVVHLLHLAEYQRGADGVLHRADSDAGARVHASEPVRQHARHPSRVPAAGGRPAFQARFVLAATLGASYGIYSGYELVENIPVKAGSEEYLDSEKYQIRPRDFRAAAQPVGTDHAREPHPT